METSAKKYEGTLDSVMTHAVPAWFHDAKLGIFIHWGLYSVPAFASTKTGDMIESIKKYGLKNHFKHNPYAEWYLNSLRIADSPTRAHHIKTYGQSFGYNDFAPRFNEGAAKWDPDEWAGLFKKVNARYVVLVSKHHDGFTLWPSRHENPFKGKFRSDRNIVSDITRVVRAQGMKMGLYYSTGLDWTFQPNPIRDFISFLCNGPIDEKYRQYCRNHLIELIDDYAPSILWADICYPPGDNVFDIFAHYYNNVEDGVVNDRWLQNSPAVMKALQFAPLGDISRKINSAIADTIARLVMSFMGVVSFPPPHCDFLTPEYATFSKIRSKKWEATRGIGNSFGYNSFAPVDQYIDPDKLIRMFVDIVSKNGNMLLNVGPTADGEISGIEKHRLRELGKWLDVNGDAIFETRPWIRAEGKTIDGVDIRFTSRNGAVYAVLLDRPQAREVSFEFDSRRVTNVKMLGRKDKLDWKQTGRDLILSMPEDMPSSAAYSLAIE